MRRKIHYNLFTYFRVFLEGFFVSFGTVGGFVLDSQSIGRENGKVVYYESFTWRELFWKLSALHCKFCYKIWIQEAFLTYFFLNRDKVSIGWTLQKITLNNMICLRKTKKKIVGFFNISKVQVKIQMKIVTKFFDWKGFMGAFRYVVTFVTSGTLRRTEIHIHSSAWLCNNSGSP